MSLLSNFNLQPVHHSDLSKIAAAAGGAAVLVGVAVLLSITGLDTSRLGAAAITSYGFNNNLTLSAANDVLAPGAATTLTWNAQNVFTTAPAIFCFGKNAGSPCGTPFQNFGTTASYAEGGWEHFSIAGADYLAVANYDNANPSKIYKWNAAGNGGVGCFGDAAGACGLALQTFVAGGGNWARGGFKHLTIGTEDYLAQAEVAGYPSKIYKWMAGSNCFGDGTNCGSAYQTFASGADQLYGGFEPFTIGTDTYLAAASNYNDSNPSKIYKWMATTLGRSSLTTFAINSAGWTLIEKGWRVDNGATVTKIGTYSTSAQTMTMKIFKFNSAGNYDVVLSQSFSHPGTGWADLTLATAYTVPLSGTYYVGVYTSAGASWGSGIAGASRTGDIIGSGQSGFIENADYFVSMRVTYQSPVTANCFGDGVNACGQPFQNFSTGASYNQGGWKHFLIGTDHYLAAANYVSDTSKIYKWMTGLNGTLTNGPASISGKIAQALQFFSTSKFLTPATSILNTDTHTISFWLKYNYTSSGWDSIMAYRPAGSDRSPGIWSHPNGNCLHWRYDPGNTGVAFCAGPAGENTYFTPGTWYHITGVKNGSTFTFYVNGSATESGTVANPKASGTASFEIGGYSAQVSLDDVRVYNRGLSAGEISTLYNLGSVTSGLAGYWTFDTADISGTTAYDKNPNPPSCFGDGISACGQPYQNFTSNATYNHGGWEYFQIGSTHYLLAGNYFYDNPKLFKWMPSSNCFGRDTASACGTALQTIAMSYGEGGFEYFTAGSDSYVAFSQVDNANPARIFKWIPGQECFGDGTTCGQPTQIFSSYVHAKGGWTHFLIGTNQYLVAGNYYWGPSDIYKLTDMTCFGNGTACASATANNTFQTLAVNNAHNTKPFTPYGSSDTYLAVANGSGLTSPLYKWIPSGPVGAPCFGRDTASACGMALQTIATNGANNWDSFNIGTNTYLAVANQTASPSSVYKWMPTCNSGNGGAGDGTTCGTPLQNIASAFQFIKFFTPLGTTDTYLAAVIPGGSDNLYKWMPSGANCPAGGGFGDGTTCGSAYQSVGISSPQNIDTIDVNGTTYFLSGNYISQSLIYKWTPSGSGCPAGGGIGNGTSCGGSYLQTFGGYSGVNNASFGTYIDGFYVGSDAYVGLIKSGGANEAGQITKFNSSTGLFDGPSPNTFNINGGYGLDAFTHGGSTYFAQSGNGLGQLSRLFKWTPTGTGCPAGGAFGDGSACGIPGSPSQTFSPVDAYAWKFFQIGGNGYLALAGGANNTVYIYKMNSSVSSSGGCRVDWSSASGSGTLASANSSTGLSTGPLNQTTTYTLKCSYPAGNNGALQNGPASVTGKLGNALSFDGVNDYVNVPSSASLPTGSVASVSAWIKPTGYPDLTYNGIVSWGPRACTGTGFLLSMKNDGKLSFASWCNDAYQTAGSAATLNAWNHVAVVLSGTTVQFYMNGVLADTKTVSAGIMPNITAGTLNIGATDNPGRYFQGSIDDVRVYNRALSATEVQALAAQGGTTDGLVGYWTFDSADVSGTTAHDSVAAAVTVGVTAPAIPTVTIIATDATAAETGGDTGTMTVTRSVSSAFALTVNYTMSGVAVNGTDYTTLTGSVIIPANLTSATITVFPTDDSVYEGPETAIATIVPNAAYTVGTPNAATVTITDSETATSNPAFTTCSGATVPPACTLSVSPTRVRKESTTNISWSVTGLVTGANGNSGNSCSITASPSSALTGPLSWPGAGTSWTGGPVTTAPIQSQTTFTLTCTAPNGATQTSVSASVTLIPTVQEI